MLTTDSNSMKKHMADTHIVARLYHAPCDNLGNIDRVAFDRNIDAIAWSVGLYAVSTEDINGVPPRDVRATARKAATAKAKAFAAPAPGQRKA